MYLGGYAVECKLKAIGMERHGCWTLEALAKKLKVREDEVYTHGLEVLLKKFGLYDKLRQSRVSHDFTSRVNAWKPNWRYNPENPQIGEAEEFLKAVDTVYAWLESNRY